MVFCNQKNFILNFGFVILCIPLCKFSYSFAERRGGFKAKVLFQCGRVGVGDGHVAGLHRHEFLVSFEVVIGREHLCTDEFFLQNCHEVQQVFGVVVADVIDFVRRERETIFAVLFFGSMLHHADYTFNDIIDVSEVTLAFAVVENLDGLACFKLVREAEVGHVRAARRTIDGKEAKSSARNVVKLAISMRHKFVALLGGGIQRYGIVDFVIGRIRNLLVAAIHARRTRIDEMLDFKVAASFENVVESDEVALDVGILIRDGVTDASLSREIHDDSEVVFFKKAVDGRLVGEICLDKSPLLASCSRERLDFFESFVLDVHVIVVGDGIKTDKFGAVIVGEQLFAKVAADKACGSSNENCFSVESNVFI